MILYTDGGLLAVRGIILVQVSFGELTGIIEKVGLKNNMGKVRGHTPGDLW